MVVFPGFSLQGLAKPPFSVPVVPPTRRAMNHDRLHQVLRHHVSPTSPGCRRTYGHTGPAFSALVKRNGIGCVVLMAGSLAWT